MREIVQFQLSRIELVMCKIGEISKAHFDSM